ncbi:MAG: DUF5688 family protein [Lachnospiraceae bacterium]
MDFNEFMEMVKDSLMKHYGEDYQVRMIDVRKNNGVLLHGISILPDEKSGNSNRISPTIYLENYYHHYKNGMTIQAVVDGIIKIYEEHRIDENIDMEFFTDYEKVRDRIVYKLINYEKNEALLQEIPHIPYLDMAIVFYYLIENEVFGTASILIYEAHMKSWEIDLKQLSKDAEYNTPRLLSYSIKNMDEMMRQLIDQDIRRKYAGEEKECIEEEWIEELTDQMMHYLLEDELKVPMYVLTNRNNQNGASCILYPGVVEAISEELDSDFFILPSSIHEVILLTGQGIENPEVLKDMVRDVNGTQLAPEEILSDQVYYFSRKSGKIKIYECKSTVK